MVLQNAVVTISQLNSGNFAELLPTANSLEEKSTTTNSNTTGTTDE